MFSLIYATMFRSEVRVSVLDFGEGLLSCISGCSISRDLSRAEIEPISVWREYNFRCIRYKLYLYIFLLLLFCQS